jgi:hypothetical protein
MKETDVILSSIGSISLKRDKRLLKNLSDYSVKNSARSICLKVVISLQDNRFKPFYFRVINV